MLFNLDGAGAHDYFWDVDQELMWRCVWAFDETELAVIAEVDKLMHFEWRKFVGIVIDFIPVELHKEVWEGWTKVEAKTAGVADIVLTPEFLIEGVNVPIVGCIPRDWY